MKKRILIVDDADVTIQMISEILIQYNFEIVGTAENGNIALEKYKQLKPDLVIMDITMPECDGIKGIEMIKEFDEKSKIIVYSALGQKKVVLDALKKGACDYLLKPFNEQKLVKILNKAFQPDLI